jgi:hypothetical protein
MSRLDKHVLPFKFPIESVQILIIFHTHTHTHISKVEIKEWVDLYL